MSIMIIRVHKNCPLLGPTLWPDHPDFKTVVSQYYGHLRGISQQIFSAFALALGVREDFSKAKLLMHQVSYA